MMDVGREQEAIRFGPTRALRSSVNALDRVSYWAIVATMLAMTVMVSLQVFFRYALGSSIDSADEVARLFFVWATFLAIPHGVRYGVHVGIDLLVLALPPGAREMIFRLSAAASALLMVLVFGYGLVATFDKWSELMPTLPISAGIFYCAVVVSAGHSFLHLLLLTLGGSRIWGGETL